MTWLTCIIHYMRLGMLLDRYRRFRQELCRNDRVLDVNRKNSILVPLPLSLCCIQPYAIENLLLRYARYHFCVCRFLIISETVTYVLYVCFFAYRGCYDKLMCLTLIAVFKHRWQFIFCIFTIWILCFTLFWHSISF